MAQIKFYKLAIYGLIFLNLFVLGFVWLSSPQDRQDRPRPTNRFQEEVEDILVFTSEQQSIFDQSHDRHEREMRRINQEEEQLLLSYFDNIANPAGELDTARVFSRYQYLQRQKLILTQAHFSEIKEILNQDQLPGFQKLMERVAERIVSKRKK